MWALNNWHDMLSFLTQKLTGEDEVCVCVVVVVKWAFASSMLVILRPAYGWGGGG